MLVLIEMDISGLYLVILRILLRAIVTNRKNFQTYLMVDCETVTEFENGAFSEREKRKSPEAGKKLRRFEERARETDLRLECTQKLQILKTEHKGLKSLSKKHR